MSLGLQCGVSTLAWGLEGYKLVVTEAGGNCQVLELTLCKSLPNSHRIPMHDGSVKDDTSWRPPEVYILQVRRVTLWHRPCSASLSTGAPRPSCMSARFAIDIWYVRQEQEPQESGRLSDIRKWARHCYGLRVRITDWEHPLLGVLRMHAILVARTGG